MKYIKITIITMLYSSFSWATSKSLEYKSLNQMNSTQEIMEQVYFVNQFYAFSYFPLEHQPKGVFTVISKTKGKLRSFQFHRFMNFAQSSPVKAKDLILVKSGKDRGQAMLITDYDDLNRSSMVQAWIPQLRKVRRFAQPLVNDRWFYTQFTHGDMKLRHPEDETHEVLGEETYMNCAPQIGMPSKTPSSRESQMQGPPCMSKGKEVLVIKSTPKNNYPEDYDYRISFVDKTSYADYGSKFYKNGVLVKEIQKNWMPVPETPMPMPRAQVFSHWWVKNYNAQSESQLIMMPLDVKTHKDMWTEGYLTKTHR